MEVHLTNELLQADRGDIPLIGKHHEDGVLERWVFQHCLELFAGNTNAFAIAGVHYVDQGFGFFVVVLP